MLEVSLLKLLAVLHPRHKLTYFETAKWQDGWIKTAEELVQHEYSDWLSRHSRKGGAESDSKDSETDSDSEDGKSARVNKKKVHLLVFNMFPA